MSADLDHIRRLETGTPLKDVDAQLVAEAPGRIHRGQISTEFAHPFEGAGEIRLAAGREPQIRAGSRLGTRLGTAQNSLGGYAPGIQAVSSEQSCVDQGDAGAQPGGPGCGDQARCPTANDDQIVASLGLGIFPVLRPDMAEKALIMGVLGNEAGSEPVLLGFGNIVHRESSTFLVL